MNSLISYLDPVNNKFHLNLSGADQDSLSADDKSFPVTVISDADPLARLIEGRIISDGGSEVKKLFLFVQRDACLLKQNALWPYTNLDVIQAWRKSFAFYTQTKKDDSSFVLLSDQLGEKGEILPFASLFYCKTQKVFFSPPCPACGRSLRQCEDDELLKAAGLFPFSTSLKRYLYCPSCSGTDYYASEREQSDPSSVRDRYALMTTFANLTKAEKQTAFPCAGCPFHDECYGKSMHVKERMVPFSFYPFYMLAFEAASVSAMDFVALISGAGFQEMQLSAESNRESGRVAALKDMSRACAESRPFLFDDERRFPEVLYLKLAFLEEVIRGFQGGGRFAHPDMKPALEQIWVSFPQKGGMLPYFWNFKVRIQGISREEAKPPLEHMTSDSGVLPGLVWFYTLLTNKRQTMSDILACLRKYIPEDAASLEKMTPENVFRAVNIFWDPQGKTVNAAWLGLWEKSLQLGWSLVTSKPDGSGKIFFEQLDRLKKEIKENLFAEEIPCAAPAAASETAGAVLSGTKDDAIHDILLGLIGKLQSVREEETQTLILKVDETPPVTVEKEDNAPGVPQEEDIEEPVTETVIFSARSSAKRVDTPSVQETQIITQDMPPLEVPMEDQETLILSVHDLEKKTKRTPEKADDLEETLILSRQPSAREVPVPPVEKTQNVFQTTPRRDAPVEDQETLILAAGNPEIQKKPKTVEASSGEETVILSTLPPVAKKVEEKPVPVQQKETRNEDFMEETVILRPGEKSKDGAKK